MNLPSVNISGLALSDMFFNSDLMNYNAAQNKSMSDETIGTAQINAALLEDAKTFAARLDGQVTAEELVKDFLSRV